jgi:hypothetical protein
MGKRWSSPIKPGTALTVNPLTGASSASTIAVPFVDGILFSGGRLAAQIFLNQIAEIDQPGPVARNS